VDLMMRNVSIRLPDKLLEALESARNVQTAAGEHIVLSRTVTIRRLLERALKLEEDRR
jgi:hypothetical protein